MTLKYFTLVWRIENFSYYWHKDNRVQIRSPEFHINEKTGTTKYRLLFSDRGIICHYLPIIKSEKYITLYVLRTDDNQKDSFTKIMNFSVMRSDKSLYHLRTKDIKISNFEKILSTRATKFLNRDYLLSDGALILVCKIMMPQSTLMFVEEQCFTRTALAVERLYFVAVIEEFGDLKPGLKRTVCIKSSSADQPIFIMDVCLSYDRELNIRIPIEADFIHLCLCKVFVWDNFGNWEKCGQDSEWRKSGEVSEFELTLDFYTLRLKHKYLENGVLTLKCEVMYTAEEEPRRFGTIGYGLDPSEILQQKFPSVQQFQKTKKGNLESPSILSEDLASLYEDGTLCDVKLRAETEIFPAHKLVLYARSPAFKKIMTGVGEDTLDYVDIHGIKANILRQLLEFVYKDKVHLLDRQNANELYLAAEKFEIVSLKLKCSNFLKLNIQPSNCQI